VKIPFLRLFTLRHARKSLSTTIALIAIIALGVAVLFSVRLANKAALSGFQLFTRSLSGGGDLMISTPSGSLPVSKLAELRQTLDTLPVVMMPVIEATAALPGTGLDEDDFDAQQVTLVGLDLMSLRNLSNARESTGLISIQSEDQDEIDLGATDRVYLTQAAATQFNIKTGETLSAVIGDELRTLTVAAVLTPGELDAGKNESVFLMDLPAVQLLTERTNSVDRVDLFIPEGDQSEAIRHNTLTALATLNAEDWVWQRADEQRQATEDMTAAFRMNLTILSGLSLIVGLYLILQALEAAVVRRRSEVGTLRALGCSPQWIERCWLLESVFLGSIGSAIGLLLGWLLAQSSVQAISRTVNALYMNTTAQAAQWDAKEALLAGSMGIAVSLLAGWAPARDAASTPPIQAIRKERFGRERPSRQPLRWSLLLLLLAWATHLMPPVTLESGSPFPIGGYLSALCGLTGAAMLSGVLLKSAANLIKPLIALSAHARIAASQLKRLTGRHRLTAAGMVAAIGMAAGMDILIHSFEGTVTNWISHTLKADLFVAVKGVENASNRNKISEKSWKMIQNDPDVDFVEIGHIMPITLQKRPTFIVGMRTTRTWQDDQFIWVKPPRNPIRDLKPTNGTLPPALISESFSMRYKTSIDDIVTLPTPTGSKRVLVQAIFADYGNERGSLVIDSQLICDWFEDRGALNLAATLKPEADIERVKTRWENTFPGLTIRTNRALRNEVITIFNQTFAVTHALKAIGILVAIAGLALALFSLVLERRAELRVLREVGFSRRDIAHSLTIEGFLMSLYGLCGGLAISVWLGYILVFVINKQSFGWTLAFKVPAQNLLLLSLGVLFASWITCYLIGHWSSQLRAELEE
jgi:putative ABC transport system permease protein